MIEFVFLFSFFNDQNQIWEFLIFITKTQGLKKTRDRRIRAKRRQLQFKIFNYWNEFIQFHFAIFLVMKGKIKKII